LKRSAAGRISRARHRRTDAVARTAQKPDDNALRYTRPPGSVTVRVRAATSVFLEVEDTAAALPSGAASRV